MYKLYKNKNGYAFGKYGNDEFFVINAEKKLEKRFDNIGEADDFFKEKTYYFFGDKVVKSSTIIDWWFIIGICIFLVLDGWMIWN